MGHSHVLYIFLSPFNNLQYHYIGTVIIRLRPISVHLREIDILLMYVFIDNLVIVDTHICSFEKIPVILTASDPFQT